MMMMASWLLSVTALFLLLVCQQTTLAAPKGDRIDALPLWGPPPTPQYSGYLDATDGCNTKVNGAFCKLHYWYAAAEHDEHGDKPVVLWLNGGPGSSSMIGFLQELGPLLMNATGGLMENPWSWTKVAHLVALESPVGVGYSYCSNQANGNNHTICQNTDKFTASASRAALVDFFTHKFPELHGRQFFITGESYAGVYVPTLAYQVLRYAPEINLVGLAVGDPCTDNDAQADSMDALWYSHKYGLVPDQDFDLLWNKCNVRLGPVQGVVGKTLFKMAKPDLLLSLQNAPILLKSEECKVAYRKFLMSSSGGLSQSWKDLFIDDYSLFAPATTLEDEQMASYMNRPDVKKALHVEETPIQTWPSPHQGFDYTSEYKACNGNAHADALSMIDFYKKIVPKLKRTWVYNGDTDPCVSYEGTRTAMTRVGFPEVDGGGYRPWFYNHTSTPLSLLKEKAAVFGPNLSVQPLGAQFGGEVVNYEEGLAFVTIHGSGHMVPQFRPQAALQMLSKLLANQDLTPLWPTNATLATMSETEFSKTMDSWTEQAMGPPYVTAAEVLL